MDYTERKSTIDFQSLSSEIDFYREKALYDDVEREPSVENLEHTRDSTSINGQLVK